MSRQAMQMALDALMKCTGATHEIRMGAIAAAANLRAAIAEDGWRPIETAPKTGEPILLCDHVEDCPPRSFIGVWQEAYGDDVTEPFVNEGWFELMGWSKTDPTHWMPPPAPPVREKNKL